MKTAPDLDDLLEDIRVKLSAAYNRGWRDGSAVMRESILRAAETPMPDEGLSQAGPVPKASDAESRAPRGLTAKAIRAVLTEEPGLPVIEIASRVTARFPEVAAKSVGNELRRREDKDYRREGKYAWFLISQGAKESGGSSSQDETPDEEAV
ncbi:hypothetical protein BH10PSE5_BH10PSE5_15820 [soil metagenome]